MLHFGKLHFSIITKGKMHEFKKKNVSKNYFIIIFYFYIFINNFYIYINNFYEYYDTDFL